MLEETKTEVPYSMLQLRYVVLCHQPGCITSASLHKSLSHGFAYLPSGLLDGLAPESLPHCPRRCGVLGGNKSADKKSAPLPVASPERVMPLLVGHVQALAF